MAQDDGTVMAVTKIFPIREKLARTVAYAANPEKTLGLADVIEYVADHDKTQKRLYESCLNCDSVASSYVNMQEVKQRYHKMGGRLGYHLIQSFAPGEVTPEQAHAIGLEFARRLFGDRFQVVIGTHLDRDHLHSHIVINSVSFVDGKKLHLKNGDYETVIQCVSDELCREHGLSVIEPKGSGQAYSEWADEKAGKPTGRQLVHADVVDAINRAYTWPDFLKLMREKGYTVKHGPNVKHIAAITKDGKRFRLDTKHGPDFSEQGIKDQLSAKQLARELGDTAELLPDALRPALRLEEPKPPRYRPPRPRHGAKLRGIVAQYYRYLYILGKIGRGGAKSRAASPLREDVIKFNRYQRQFHFLRRNNLTTMKDFHLYHHRLKAEITALKAERIPLYRKRRRTPDETESENLSAQIDAITGRLRELYKKERICRGVAQSAAAICETVRQAELSAEKSTVKGGTAHERKRTGGRSDGDRSNATD
jgi:hypothetical protein